MFRLSFVRSAGFALPRPVMAWGVWVVGEMIRAAGALLWGAGWLGIPFQRGKGERFPALRGLRHLGRWLVAFPVEEMVLATLAGNLGFAVVSRKERLVLGHPRKRKGGGVMEEKRKILEMVAAGKITPEEGVRLLDALETSEVRPTRPSRKGHTLLIEVHDLEDDEHVVVRLPLSLIRWAVKAGISFKALAASRVEDPEVRSQVERAFEALNELDFDRLVEEAQELGDLVRVDSDEARVSIRIE